MILKWFATERMLQIKIGVILSKESRHWRLNAQRYRMEGFIVEGIPSLQARPVLADGENGAGFLGGAEAETLGLETTRRDHRLMGAMLVPFYDGNLVLVVDEAKAEGVGRVNTWELDPVVGRYGLPAGGQMGNETTYGTIYRELGEEMPNIDLAWINRREFEQVSTYPFVVNQLKLDNAGALDHIHQIAVTVRGLDISDNPQLQNVFAKAGGVLWPICDVARYFDQLVEGGSCSQMMFRPQVVVAAAFAMGRLDEQTCVELNRETIRQGYQVAHQNDVSVVNGSFGVDGRLNPALTVEQCHYLGVANDLSDF